MSDQPVAQPAAIAEIGLPAPTVPALPEMFDTGCRDDLLQVDGEPVPLRITGSTAHALTARPLTVTPCRPDEDGRTRGDRTSPPPAGGATGDGEATAPTLDLTAGEHRLTAHPGLDTGIDIDQLVLRSSACGAPSENGGALVTEAIATTRSTAADSRSNSSDDCQSAGNGSDTTRRSDDRDERRTISDGAAGNDVIRGSRHRTGHARDQSLVSTRGGVEPPMANSARDVDAERRNAHSAGIGDPAGDAQHTTGGPDNAGRVDELVERAAPQVEVADEDPDRVPLRVSGATPDEPFWLVLGQSYNTGWQATADGRRLAEPELVDGFANGWLIDPDTASFDVTLDFAPQRRVDIALWVSAISAAGCLLLALRPPRQSTTGSSAGPLALLLPGRNAASAGSVRLPLLRRLPWTATRSAALTRRRPRQLAVGPMGPARRPSTTDPSVVSSATSQPEPFSTSAAFRYDGTPPSRTTAWLTTLGVGVLSWALSGPMVGFVVGTAAGIVTRRSTARRFLLLAAPAAVVVIIAYVLYIQVRHAPMASFDWPHELRRVHPLGWLAVLLLTADVLVAPTWRQRKR